ncbi:hypothetical protein [Hymenobacter persicinus]|uniref:Uncharacterized protein n=1 Tax=Hymenobacter persicinus TaxID=2025506 RepID=A0A4V1ZAV1_9BACT|nr:hypothetical protein [Hymenobacter persicinus]RYU80276.1 hypothetical protein EWM57_08815 [Hymenobacter persicinus]
MDPTRNPADDTDFDFDAWVRWQNLKQAWQHATAARPAPRPVVVPEPRPEPEIVYLLPVPN